jgi:ketosteroid isomerase-like protein
MNRRALFLFAVFAVVLPSLAAAPEADAVIRQTVQRVLDDQARAWNAGNIEGFMEGYDKSDTLRFASGGKVHHGWKTTLDNYKKNYPDKPAMGALTFSEIDITVLSPDAAMAFGRWRLKREKDEPSGLFTLIFRKTQTGWRIVHDHTSLAVPEAKP